MKFHWIWRFILVTLQAFHRDICPLMQQGLAKFMEVIWVMIHVVDCATQLVPQMLDGVAVRGLWRLVLLLQILSHYPGTMRRSIVMLVAKSIPNVLPSKWFPDVPKDVPMHHAIDVLVQEPNGRFCTPLQLRPWQTGSLAGSVFAAVDELAWGHRPGTVENMTHLPRRRGYKQLQSSSVTSVSSLGGAGMIGSQQGFRQDPARTAAYGHRCVFGCQTANKHSIKFHNNSHPLSEGNSWIGLHGPVCRA